MYDELYAAWLMETESSELGSLPSDFYSRAANYLQKILSETRLLDKNSLKANLLEKESANAKRMLAELISTRYRKIVKMATAGREVSVDSLTAEEAKLYNVVAPSTEAYSRFVSGVLQGQVVPIDPSSGFPEPKLVHKRVTLRFLKPVPPIIGSDMKSYGPFAVEDVASVPSENAKILVKQGLAKPIEVG